MRTAAFLISLLLASTTIAEEELKAALTDFYQSAF